MILILSEKNDRSTQDVIDWLLFMDKDYFVIYPNTKLLSFDIYLTNNVLHFILYFENKTVDSSEIDAYWYRRGHINHWFELLGKKRPFYKKINTHMVNEWKIVQDMLCTALESKLSIGSWDANRNSNKLLNLLTAIDCDFDIPDTGITTSKQTLREWNKKMPIAKSINGDIKNIDKNKIIFANFGPMLINQNNIDLMADFFFPSLFQNNISKKYELRVFVLGEKIFTMAIFSQNSQRSNLDSRIPDPIKPVREVPYKLPIEIENKIRKFMQKTMQNSASIDIIVTKNDKYIFLESNPVGQFGYVSSNCNYHIEFEIASNLSSKSL